MTDDGNGAKVIGDDDLTYKKGFFDEQFCSRDAPSHDGPKYAIATGDNDGESSFFLKGDGADAQRYWRGTEGRDLLRSCCQKDRVSIFCHFDCTKILDVLTALSEFSVHLTYFRAHSFPVDRHNVLPFSGSITSGYDPATIREVLSKLERDLFAPYESHYGRSNIAQLKRDFVALAGKSRNIYAARDGNAVGCMISLPYHDEQLDFSYHLIAAIWLDRLVLNRQERRAVAEQFFRSLSDAAPPFGAAVHVENGGSRKFFERNGFTPYWIRMTKR